MNLRKFFRTKLVNIVSKVLNNRTVKTIVYSKVIFTDLNYTTQKEQKRALMCYLPGALLESEAKNAHPKFQQQLIFLSVLFKFGYSVDLVDYTNVDAINERKDVHYDLVLGQGEAYEAAINKLSFNKSVLFLTENNPAVVIKKYEERTKYFIERHPDIPIDCAKPRVGIFTNDMLSKSHYIISMSGEQNNNSLTHICNHIFKVNANTCLDHTFCIDESDLIKNRKNFVWFGSLGLVHKGLDILLDIFKELPDYTLNVYGVPATELDLFNKLKSHNTILHPNVNVNSDRFVDEVIRKNSFVISTSCSEGMQTGIATCMRYGLVPIVTPECGYDKNDCLITIDNWHVNETKMLIVKAANMENSELIRMSTSAFELSNNQYTGINFEERLKYIFSIICS